jgi:hypothetical protein
MSSTSSPDFKAHEDRRGLLSRHGDTIAGPRIDLDDLLLLHFVLRAQDKSRKIGAILQLVDDYPIDLRSERSQYVCYQIMGEGSLLLRSLHEHRDCHPNALIDEHHENLILVAKEDRGAAAHSGHGADLHFDNRFTHIANLVTRLPAKIRIPFER